MRQGRRGHAGDDLCHGGPEGPDDVVPFLENVVRGKNVPHERLMAVARHYEVKLTPEGN